MNFFAYQEEARKKTSVLVFYFVLAVILIIAFVYFAIQFSYFVLLTQQKQNMQISFNFWNQDLFLLISIAVIILISLGTFFKIIQISKGGESIAILMGGVKISPNTKNPLEKKLMNIVEEMSIASGCPIPTVFVMPQENGINAFAAGFSINDAVIAVTKGTLEKLNRDELQGVIAHEFSHIFNGDMKLNLRLIGILHGILLIGMLGATLLRIMWHSNHHRRFSSNRDDKKDVRVLLAVSLMGGLLYVIGYVGVFFGKLIKSAISREREYLADASAVQFTRNPEGIANALKKIAGFSIGSKIISPKAEETSHLFFENPLKSSFLSLLATHPPIEERIKRLDPRFSGTILKSKDDYNDSIQKSLIDEEENLNTKFNQSSFDENRNNFTFQYNQRDIINKIGTIDIKSVRFANGLINSIPLELKEIIREPFGARSIILYFLIDENPSIKNIQMTCMNENCNEIILKELNKIAFVFKNQKPEFKLHYIDIAITALKDISFPQYEEFMNIVNLLIKADKRVSLFEYTLLKILNKNLGSSYFTKPKSTPSYYSLNSFTEEIEILMSVLAHFGNEKLEDSYNAFTKGISALKINKPFHFVKYEDFNFYTLDKALDIFSKMIPPLKKQLINACLQCIFADKIINVKEVELIRAIGEVLEIPVPLVIKDETI